MATNNISLLSRYGHVLVVVSRCPEIRVRELAKILDVTDRAVYGILCELIDSGYLRRYREGRRNRYELSVDMMLLHPIERVTNLCELIALFATTRGEPWPLAARPPAYLRTAGSGGDEAGQ